MPVISEYSLPKGNVNMTQIGGTNDDSTVTLPDMGFNFYYDGNTVRQLYTSGNTWVGFGASSEHLKINRKDTSYNKLFYIKEMEHGINLFRIRFEGNSYYSSWSNNDLIWELSVFETGVIRLVIEKIPNNGTNSFNNPGIGTQTLTLTTGKSYIFTPNDPNGRNFIIQEGSYIPCNSKYLMVDSEGIKNFQTIEGASTWVKIGDLPLTEEMFNTYGVDNLPDSLDGLIDAEPLLYHYTDNPDVIGDKILYGLKLSETVTSKPRVIIQNTDFTIHEGKSINRFEAVVATVRKDVNGNDVATNGKLRIAISLNSGLSWLTYNNVNFAFESIDINDSYAFLNSGINPSSLLGLDYIALNTMLESERKLRFAYILEKPTLSDVCKLRKMKIFYN